jgi:error-prone DNA polymerase
MNDPPPDFAELVAATHFSFLRGASHPSDMVHQALEHGYRGIGIADINTVAGVVRGYSALKKQYEETKEALIALKVAQGKKPKLSKKEDAACWADIRYVVGARLVFADDTPDIVAYPMTRKGWGNLTCLLTSGNLRSLKGGCILHYEDLLAHLEELLLIVLPVSTAIEINPHPKEIVYPFRNASHMAAPQTPLLRLVKSVPQGLEAVAKDLAREAPGRVWLGASMHRQGQDERKLEGWRQIARAACVPLLATNDVLYATAEQRALQDVLTCIRESTTITEAGKKLKANAERHLKSPAEMARLFRSCPEAIDETIHFLSKIEFKLTDLSYEYPHEPVPPGWEPQAWLEHVVLEAAYERYGKPLPRNVKNLIAAEFKLIRKKGYAYYFLTVYDLVKFARAQKPPILCQGRGSAANSLVCFLLDVTSIDPVQHDLLFSRFVSKERGEPPDIDVDFEHERREEVMQHIYKRYGRHRAGIAATVIHYRSRSAVREVAKVLGLSEDVSRRIADTVWGSYGGDVGDQRIAEAGFNLANPEIIRLRTIMEQLLDAEFPRHLSQHVGGFVLTQDRLDETVPVHRAAMDDRTFIEWDKDDIDTLNLMKVDVLALGMLTCIRKAFDLMRSHGLGDHTLKLDLGSDDPAVYKMLSAGESIGVFQVESRAQINMLPRLKPEKFYDLAIQVAIVRPGPIEGDMVHPYLRRRNEEETVEFPSPSPEHGPPDELHSVLGKTLGVPLFQEQAMKLVITAAKFSAEDANRFRRSMATFRNVGTMPQFETKMVEGMVKRGYERDFAERCYAQIKGFGSYGFPESHALSFARLVYVSAWIKCHHPVVFACALLNSQPMGFYAPAQIVGDARKNGVEVRPADVKFSHWDNGLEVTEGGHALRLGFRQIDGFLEGWANDLASARTEVPFANMEDLARRAKLPSRAMRLLADADACGSLDQGRREALWEVRRIPSDQLPLFAAAQARELGLEPDAALPAMPLNEHVTADYQMTRLSLKGHPMQFLRESFRAKGVLSCRETSNAKNGALVRVAGIVLVRQRPGKGNAIFITIEDETGITNILLWARLFEMQRRPVMASRLIVAEGTVQKSKEEVVHLMATRIHDYTHALDRLSDAHRPTLPICRADEIVHPQPPRARHPRNVRILPKSRDFH